LSRARLRLTYERLILHQLYECSGRAIEETTLLADHKGVLLACSNVRDRRFAKNHERGHGDVFITGDGDSSSAHPSADAAV